MAEKPRILGEVPEWLNGAVSKTVEDASPSWVRIPVSPPIFSGLIIRVCYSRELKPKLFWIKIIFPERPPFS